MANLTLTIDDEVLKCARLRAIEDGTSVNRVVRDYLESYAGTDRLADAVRSLVDPSHATSSGSGPGGRTWTRDELHVR